MASTSNQLAAFYLKFGPRTSFPSGTVDAIEAYLYGIDQFQSGGDITSVKARVDAMFARFNGVSVGSVLQTPSGKPGFFAGSPIAYSSLKMLKEVLDFASTKQISYADSAKRQHFTIVVAVATCGQGKRALNPGLTQQEQIRVSVDPRLRLNNYAGIRSSLQVFQAYLWAITKGAFVVDVVVKEISACVTLSSERGSDGRLRMGMLGNDLWSFVNEHVNPQTKQADMVLFVYPSNRPKTQIFKDQKIEIITGGAMPGPRALTIFSDDSWFVEKPPHLGSGEWTDVERRVYLSQWYQHEVFHVLFYNYKQFNLEVNGHDWFNKAFWPADFTPSRDTLEADYFSNCVYKRFIPRLNPGLGVSLLTALPSLNFVRNNWGAISPTLAGSYSASPATNGWHYVTISRSGTNTWVWKNNAGVSWDVLWDGLTLLSPKSPYGALPITLSFSRTSEGFFRTTVTGIYFNSQAYARTSSARATLDTTPPTPLASSPSTSLPSLSPLSVGLVVIGCIVSVVAVVFGVVSIRSMRPMETL